MKAFYQLTHDEVSQLTEQGLQDAIRLEAIERGIKVPVGLPSELVNMGLLGFRYPAEVQVVFGIAADNYNTPAYGYLNRDLAVKAMEGIVRIGNRYTKGGSQPTLETCEPKIVEVAVGISRVSDKVVAFKEADDGGSEEFDKLAQECVDKCSQIRQERYNLKVRITRKAEYLRLAGGEEMIARAFWAKAGEGVWPDQD